MRRAETYLPCHIRKMVYQSLVLQDIDYCAVAWHTRSTGTNRDVRLRPLLLFAVYIGGRDGPVGEVQCLLHHFHDLCIRFGCPGLFCIELLTAWLLLWALQVLQVLLSSYAFIQ